MTDRICAISIILEYDIRIDTKTEIKPCPFCGAEPVIDNDGGGWYINCDNWRECPVTPRSSGTYTRRDGCIRAWNTRTEEEE